MKQQYATQYDKMTKMPIPQLILRLGLPTTFSMLVTNLYNIVDTWFVGRIGISASGATSIVFGLMAIIQAVGFMYGQGAGSNLSRRLGARQPQEASRFAATGFYLSLLTGGAILVLGLLFLDPLCRLLGSTDTILPYARVYAACILLAAPAMASSCVMNNVLRFEGRAVFAMVGLVAGGVLNMFGDAVFIFGFDMGILGAGLSTLLSQYISAGILLSMFVRKKTQTNFHLKNFAPGKAIVWPIISVGLPSLIRQGLTSVSTMVLNGHAKMYGDAAVAALSIVARLCNFLFCVGIGIGQGFQPVSAFNYGAKQYRRVRQSLYFTYLFGTALMTVFAVFGFFWAAPLVRVMRDDPAVVAIGVPAMRAQCVALLFMPVALMANMLFQSTGHSLQASIVSSMRSGLCFIPVVLLLARFFGLVGIELSQPVADTMAAALSVPFLVKFLKELPEENVTENVG